MDTPPISLDHNNVQRIFEVAKLLGLDVSGREKLRQNISKNGYPHVYGVTLDNRNRVAAVFISENKSGFRKITPLS